MRRLILGVGMLILTGCDAGPRAVPLHDGDGKAPVAETKDAPAWADKPQPPADARDIEEASNPAPGSTAAADPVTHAEAYPPLPVPKGHAMPTATRYGDWPLWSTNRKYSADDNAHYQFGKHGGEIGAASYGDYVAAVHGFVHHPPAGTETLSRRNGDTLFYNARQNVFAVMTRDGAPRTLFRPYDGAAYWQKQKAVEAGRSTGGDS